MAEEYVDLVYSRDRAQYESPSVRDYHERKSLRYQQHTAGYPQVTKGMATDEWPELGEEEANEWEEPEMEEQWEPPDDDAEEDEEYYPQEEQYLSGEITKPYLDEDDEDALEEVEKSGKPLADLLQSGLTASAWKQLVEMRKDRVLQAVHDLSDGDNPIYDDELAAHLGLEDADEVKDIIADLAEDGLVEPVTELSPQVERAMTDLRGAWNKLVRQDKQRQREKLRQEVRDLRVGFDRLLGRR
jgi:hypothetical protein